MNPEEIKRGLKSCGGAVVNRTCPCGDYKPCCQTSIAKDALAYIEQLETENKKLKELRDQVWMKQIRGYCGACKYNHGDEQVNFKCWECLFKTKTRNPNSEEYHPLWEYEDGGIEVINEEVGL